MTYRAALNGSHVQPLSILSPVQFISTTLFMALFFWYYRKWASSHPNAKQINFVSCFHVRSHIKMSYCYGTREQKQNLQLLSHPGDIFIPVQSHFREIPQVVQEASVYPRGIQKLVSTYDLPELQNCLNFNFRGWSWVWVGGYSVKSKLKVANGGGGGVGLSNFGVKYSKICLNYNFRGWVGMGVLWSQILKVPRSD